MKTLCVWFLLAAAPFQSREVTAPLSAPLPAGVDASKKWKLVREADGKELPFQVVKGTLHWIDSVPADGARAYRLEPGELALPAGVECIEEKGKHVTLRAGGKDVLRYAVAVVEPPAGVNPAHASAGFIHPVWSPSGRVVSNNFPRGHEHHHGIWSAWRQAEFEGRTLNGFAPLEKLGKMELVKLEGTFSGPVFGGFRSRQRLVDLNAPGGPKAALEEVWEVRVYATGDAFVFDVDTTQTCAGESPLTVLKYHYGGMGFRGSSEWAGKDGVAFLTSEGKTRVDGNGVPARWVAMNGRIGGKDAGVGLLCHPSNFRAPQPTRLNPDDPYFSWVPACTADFKIEPAKPYIARYRFVVADRTLTAAEMERRWSAYAEPSKGITLAVK
jgi:hypothetical protein